jgi:hypothetical protein
MSWKVVYHYTDQEDAEQVFDGVSRAYDRADRLELVDETGNVVETIYVTYDAAKAAGVENPEQGARR